MAEISWPWQYSFPPFFTKTWNYINEGNAHIVIGIQEHNPVSNYVLRLIKDGKSIQKNNIRTSADFVNLIMMPLVSNTNYGNLEVVELPAQELAELSQDLAKFRPKERLTKSQISCYAIKTKNLTILNPKADNYCVEIKPKEGFLSHVFKEYGKCYYCLKQYLKLQEQQISNASKYCPLNLFSGDRNRMRTALFHLSENPQNNFKLFKNGQIIFSEANKNQLNEIIANVNIFKSTDVFFDFIIETLLSIGHKQKYNLKTATVIKKQDNCDDVSNLNEQTTLFKILQTQKLSEVNAMSTATLNIDTTNYVSTILEKLGPESDLYNNTERVKFLDNTDAVHLALISAIAKDCSIMITFSNQHYTDDDDDIEFVQFNEHKIPFRVSVTDLEPKLAKTLAKRKETERKLIEVYERYLIQKTSCPHSETRSKQLEAWQQLIADYLKTMKQSTIDIRESQNTPLFNNQAINRKLSQESVLTILEYMAKVGQAAPLDKSKNVWEVYWHSLDEWGNMVYTWASNNGMNNSVCTLFELREGENTIDEEFHGLDMAILIKALKSLEAKGKCELIEFDNNQGVKFF